MVVYSRKGTHPSAAHGSCRNKFHALLAIVVMFFVTAPAWSGSLEQAKRIHDRIAGVPPSDQVLKDMRDDIDGIGGRDAIDAAYRAMDSRYFYDVTLKNFATPWTNRDQTVFADLNDYTATVIGMVRDDVPFNTLLSADVLYHGGTAGGVPPYSAGGSQPGRATAGAY